MSVSVTAVSEEKDKDPFVSAGSEPAEALKKGVSVT